jgi:hypothetical protein
LFAAAIVCACFAGRAAPVSELPVPQIRLPLMISAPVLDGQVNAAEWVGAARMEGFGRGPVLAPLEAAFWVGCDGTNLFLAVVSETPPGGKLLANIAPLPDDRDARTWLDDSIELVLDPLPDAPPGQRRLYHANINARGAINDTIYIVGGSAEAWRGRWRTVSRVIGDRWHFELALPLADLGLATAPAGRTLGVRIGRNWCQTPLAGQTEWSPLGGAYLTPETIPQVTWDAAAPVVQVMQLTDADTPGAHIKLTVANPGPARLAVRVALACRPKNSAPYDVVQALALQPGETAPVELAGPALNEAVATAIRVTSPDEKAVYYLREFSWQAGRPATVWTVDQAATRKIQTQFAYYPSFSKVHFTADITGLEQREQVTGAQLSLRRQGQTESLAATNLPPFALGRTGLMWDVSPLPEGEYEAVFTLRGVATDPIVQPFVRHVFPWENNTLGKSDTLVEPFTAMEVKGRTVATILRRHTLGTLGLWDQVESLGQELLSGPMRLEVKSQGSGFRVQGSGFKVVEQRATRVVTESAWSSGGLKGSARGEWDYDGMQKWILTLEPSAVPVEALTLIIPLNDKRMPLLHACTDGLRFNYAGATPAGDGRVWDGTKAARNSIIGSYVPYIWLGAEERGLAVFGENDRGWITATNVPCQELVRNGNGLELRLNLIAKPTMIDAPRRIMIGFQATPTKPMPANWRQWAVSWAARVPPEGKKIAFLGSCWYWGTLTPCLDLYPRDEDLSIWDEFKKTRETGVVNQPFIESWLKGYTVKTHEQFTIFKNHVNSGFHTLKGKPTDVLLYTNARGVRFDTREGQTFLDEWHRDAFSTRDWPIGGGVAYDLNPGASFRDYALWYYHKMLTTFADHIYWDDIFLQSDFDLVGTEAYELPDGTVQPAAGLFDMRELIRRTAVMQHELGRKGRANQPHITNTAIAPILSFAGSHLTWEDRVGDTDFQDRYSRDYIRAESIGRQFGNVPFALQLIKGPDTNKTAWAARTMAGVALVHEIRSIGVLPGAEANLKTLYDYGYGQPDVSVMNYWEEDLPVTLSRADAVQLIVTKPGSALVLVCDYGNGGEVLLKSDLKRLGIARGLTATNVETGLPLDVTGDGQARLVLKKHDFALVRIEGER